MSSHASFLSVITPICDDAYFNEFSLEDFKTDEEVDNDGSINDPDNDLEEEVDSNDLVDHDDNYNDDDAGSRVNVAQDMAIIREFLEGQQGESDQQNIYALPADILNPTSRNHSSTHNTNELEYEPYDEFYAEETKFHESCSNLLDYVQSMAKEKSCNEQNYIKISNELLSLFKSNRNMMNMIIDINHDLKMKIDQTTLKLKEAQLTNETISEKVSQIQKELHHERKNKCSILKIFRL
ncbi:MAG: hypothetical protein CME10_14845 [Gemmatimonadetes bacterium]|nr:hypothetical protein [Gemmatimonadota bacterium]|tara:strand:+ start:682 stop:1395 length:714 start_codon:yes stop_codon:yes gene_type:complete